MLTVVIGSFMGDDMVDDMPDDMVDNMVHVMVLFFWGRSKDERVLHRHLRRHRREVEFIKVLETLGLMRLGQVCEQEISHCGTQNKDKKEGKRAASPPLSALE